MSDILTHLSRKIQDEIKRIEEDTVMGKAEDFAAYKYACGIYRGLLMASTHIAELAQRMEHDDD